MVRHCGLCSAQMVATRQGMTGSSVAIGLHGGEKDEAALSVPYRLGTPVYKL
jgi:hypothetical protein